MTVEFKFYFFYFFAKRKSLVVETFDKVCAGKEREKHQILSSQKLIFCLLDMKRKSQYKRKKKFYHHLIQNITEST